MVKASVKAAKGGSSLSDAELEARRAAVLAKAQAMLAPGERILGPGDADRASAGSSDEEGDGDGEGDEEEEEEEGDEEEEGSSLEEEEDSADGEMGSDEEGSDEEMGSDEDATPEKKLSGPELKKRERGILDEAGLEAKLAEMQYTPAPGRKRVPWVETLAITAPTALERTGDKQDVKREATFMQQGTFFSSSAKFLGDSAERTLFAILIRPGASQ